MNYILICDDVLDNCIFLQTILELEGYTVEVVTSGIDAINRIRHQKPDLLMLDLMMPDINGFEVANIIQQDKHLQSLPILIVTAYQEAIESKPVHIKVNGILEKPVDVDTLVQKVQDILNVVK
ncbi:MAG: response regulator [Aulosira sp. ZfuVER01]|nr:response regulator [Aulosira sp. ZfuVER01]MDZ7997675.1 response regulator [Aulosira sp. DedVER01a]MDZ8055342.1 response regulator [Aulosira sp. ZfuCHP01]